LPGRDIGFQSVRQRSPAEIVPGVCGGMSGGELAQPANSNIQTLNWAARPKIGEGTISLE
jgi:hypothetical protein